MHDPAMPSALLSGYRKRSRNHHEGWGGQRGRRTRIWVKRKGTGWASSPWVSSTCRSTVPFYASTSGPASPSSTLEVSQRWGGAGKVRWEKGSPVGEEVLMKNCGPVPDGPQVRAQKGRGPAPLWKPLLLLGGGRQLVP